VADSTATPSCHPTFYAAFLLPAMYQSTLTTRHGPLVTKIKHYHPIGRRVWLKVLKIQNIIVTLACNCGWGYCRYRTLSSCQCGTVAEDILHAERTHKAASPPAGPYTDHMTDDVWCKEGQGSVWDRSYTAAELDVV